MLAYSSKLFHSSRFHEKKKNKNKKQNIFGTGNYLLAKFSIRAHAYEKLDCIAPPQHLFRDVDFGDKHLHSLTISVR